jgi:hypothetical protein
MESQLTPLGLSVKPSFICNKNAEFPNFDRGEIARTVARKK